ncbi:hypothetical protein AK88_03632 [Plasmodium fragile]|uniref:KELT protein n=1 Tax=Plasmodium fragile TaxID=5857 RepID=A0A0D9QI25_PLAFR|nr:uncharacterized protein AK88_03632 [Plasmodium fragile]KJP86720.1 hypothetical protein AK88_03632 [Plasmodium fragile]
MKYFYKLAIVLSYIHTYFMQYRCVRKVVLAENEPECGVKSGDRKGSCDDTIIEVIKLFSFDTLEEEADEQKKSEKECAVGEEEEIESGEACPRRSRSFSRPAYDELEDNKKYKGKYEEEVQLEHVQEKETSSSESPSKDEPEQTPKNTNDPEIHEFRHVLMECSKIPYEINEEVIEGYLKARIHGPEEISQLHNEYPLYLSKGIDFDNIRMPFGVVQENFEQKSETELFEMLHFDDFMNIQLFDFLNTTMIGNLSLARINSLYIQQRIKYLPCYSYLLEYLGKTNTCFNIYRFFNNNMGTYLSEEKSDICNFNDAKIRIIQEKNMKNSNAVERLKEIRKTRHLTNSEREIVGDMIFYQVKNISCVKNILSFFARKRTKIRKDALLISQHFPLPKHYIYRDDILLTSLHYTLSYAIVTLRPLMIKVVEKELIERSEFYFTSALINNLLVVLEFIEHNSQLCQQFFKTYNDLSGFCPRVQSIEDIIITYNYLMMRRQICSIMYNICKLHLKFQYCEYQITNYEDNIFGDYVSLIASLEHTLNDAKNLL